MFGSRGLYTDLLTFEFIKVNPGAAEEYSPFSSRPVITLHYPMESGYNPKLQIGILTPFLYENDESYGQISITKSSEITTYSMNWRYRSNNHNLFVCGGFKDALG